MQAALREAIAAEEQQKREEKILEDQAETHVEEKKAAEFKNKVQTVKKSHEVRNSGLTKTQSQRRGRGATEVQQTVQQFQAAEGTREDRNFGKTDGNDMRKPEAT